MCNLFVFVSDYLEEDQFSETTSGDSGSVGGVYRLNDIVGLSDVQQMARMQEESKYYDISRSIFVVLVKCAIISCH